MSEVLWYLEGGVASGTGRAVRDLGSDFLGLSQLKHKNFLPAKSEGRVFPICRVTRVYLATGGVSQVRDQDQFALLTMVWN